jgi:hypothetical protein
MRRNSFGLPVPAAIMRPKGKAESSELDLGARPSNVVPFPRARRGTPIPIPAPRRNRPTAAAAAHLNARLLLLLGICTMSATSALLAVHILYG